MLYASLVSLFLALWGRLGPANGESFGWSKFRLSSLYVVNQENREERPIESKINSRSNGGQDSFCRLRKLARRPSLRILLAFES